MFLIHLNCQTLKTLFSNSSDQNEYFNKFGLYTFFLLYLWAKYTPIWTDFAPQTVTLGATLLVRAQTIPKSARGVVPNSEHLPVFRAPRKGRLGPCKNGGGGGWSRPVRNNSPFLGLHARADSVHSPCVHGPR